MDITNAYVHELGMHRKAIYVRQLADSRGRFAHGKTMGRSLKNLWGGKTAGHNHVQYLFEFLRWRRDTTANVGTCLLSHTKGRHCILYAIKVDNFLVLASVQVLIESLYDTLTRKYFVIRLGRRTEFLGWSVSYKPKGETFLSQANRLLPRRLLKAPASKRQTDGKRCTIQPQNHLHRRKMEKSSWPPHSSMRILLETFAIWLKACDQIFRTLRARWPQTSESPTLGGP